MLYINDAITNHTVLTLEWLQRLRIADSEKISEIRYIECDYKKGNEKPQVDETWKTISSNDCLYGREKHWWLYFKFTLPKRFIGKTVYLTLAPLNDWDVICDQHIVYINDEQIKTFDPYHTEIKLDSSKTEFEIYLYTYSGLYVVDYFTGEKGGWKVGLDFKVIQIDDDTEKLYYRLKVLEDILQYSEKDTREYAVLEEAVKGAKNRIDLRQPRSKECYDSMKEAVKYLDEGIFASGNPYQPKVSCMGHTHIDIAWLWTVQQTREKAQRSFATVIELMKRYPEYKFSSSQPILYEMVKEETPALYEEIKERIKEGRWEAEGGMWLEADCNLTSGESLVRQILFGKRFFKEEFDVESEVLWLPDVFGYSAALPQILKKSGIEYFVTSKLGWNDTNTMPYDMFTWKGLDGSGIFTYLLTCQAKKFAERPKRYTCYGTLGEAAYVAGTWERMQQKDLTDEVLFTYGYADGGGGSRKEDIEQLKLMQKGLPNCPITKFENSKEFLKRVKAKAESTGKLPTWDGELYFEFHRGTYTSQAKIKRNNRKGEFALINGEWLSVLSGELTGKLYPKAELHGAWKKLLLNQFHDILPGSAIEEANIVTAKEHAEILETAERLREENVTALLSQVNTDKDFVVFNPHSCALGGEVLIDGKYYHVENVPAKGYKACDITATESKVKYQDRNFENDFYTLVFDDNYELASIFDKRRNRELVADGQRANRFRTYEDLPIRNDAWDINADFRDKYWDILSVENVTLKDEGERKGVEITRKYLSCSLKQTVWLYNNTARIDFDTEIDWDIPHVLLKVLFPLNLNTNKAICDVQFGNVERSTHKNTSWDRARFEFCAHKYVDICDGSFGVALMNDCKYGYGVDKNELSLTLIKCSSYPDYTADKGKHVFTYSIYSHDGYNDREEVIWESYLLNNPLQAVKACKGEKGLPEEYSLLSCENKNVIVETIKQTEDGEDIVVRLFETTNKQTEVTLNVGFDFSTVCFADLLERREKEVPFEGRQVKLIVKPFEIVTLVFKK